MADLFFLDVKYSVDGEEFDAGDFLDLRAEKIMFSD